MQLLCLYYGAGAQAIQHITKYIDNVKTILLIFIQYCKSKRVYLFNFSDHYSQDDNDFVFSLICLNANYMLVTKKVAVTAIFFPLHSHFAS